MAAVSMKKISTASSIRSSPQGLEEPDSAFPQCAASCGLTVAVSRFILLQVKDRPSPSAFQCIHNYNSKVISRPAVRIVAQGVRQSPHILLRKSPIPRNTRPHRLAHSLPSNGWRKKMTTVLSVAQAFGVIKSGKLGRLGCIDNDEPYVVPINYVVDERSIYSHSLPGKKIDVLRSNPRACLQVDQID